MKIGVTYKIVVDVDNNILTYTGTITETTQSFITFIDKFNKEFTYNINKIVSCEELK